MSDLVPATIEECPPETRPADEPDPDTRSFPNLMDEFMSNSRKANLAMTRNLDFLLAATRRLAARQQALMDEIEEHARLREKREGHK